MPVVPSKGSVGSSGDLAPLAHLGARADRRGRGDARRRALPGGEALARAGPRAGRARGQGGARAHQRHAPDGGGRRARGARRAAAARRRGRRRRALARGVQGLDRPVRRAPARAAPPARRRPRSPRGCARCSRGSPVVASHADCGRVQDPYTLRCAPQVLGAVERRARLRRRPRSSASSHAVTDNPLVFPRRRRHPLGRQLPRPAAVAAARPPRARARASWPRSRERRTYALLSPSYAGLPPFLSPRPGPLVRADDRPVRGGRAGQRVPGARAPGRRRLDPDQRRPGGLQLDGRAGGAEGAHGGRERRAGRSPPSSCAPCQGLEFHRPLRSTPAARGGASRACASYVPRVEEDRSLAGELAALADALRTGEVVL